MIFGAASPNGAETAIASGGALVEILPSGSSSYGLRELKPLGG
jgi:hypothetical protein